MHAYQDSSSHQNIDVPKTFLRSFYDKINFLPNNSPYTSDVGHLPDGEWPDKTYNRPELADKMAKQTYDELREFLIHTGSAPKASWSDISGTIYNFNRTKIEDENAKGQTLFK